MKIGFVSGHCCIRVIKEGIALYMAGHDVRFIQARLADQSFLNILPWMSFYANGQELVAKAAKWDFDIVHVHNEPDWMTVAIKDVRPDLKVVHDCHDLDSARYGKPGKNEAEALKVADGLIFPSVGYAKHFDSFYGKDERPKEIVYSMCLEIFLNHRQLPRCNGIVYEGGTNIAAEEGFVNGRDYRGIAQDLCTMGIPFYVYSAHRESVPAYEVVGAIAFPPMGYTSLMQQINRYDWGFCGSSVGPYPGLDWTMPNKVFEYTTAGIPSIVLDAHETGEFVKKHELGVVIDSVKDIPDIYDQHEHYREKVREKRHLFTMETQVPKIESLYQKVLGK